MENYNARYARHYSLKDFGQEGQQKLAAAKVLVIGAGGLGCPVLHYLVASGIGGVGIVDNDIVSLSNLQRQVLYATDDLGKFKVEVAAEKLKRLNPETKITIYKTAISSKNALEIIVNFDIVVDCTDNFASRYLINDACVLLDKPLVFGAVYQYEGQVAVFNVKDKNGVQANYRHLFPNPPQSDEVQNCNEAGVLGVLPGIIGVMQATEVIKLLTKIGEVLLNKLLTYNLLNHEIFILEITGGSAVYNLIPKTEIAFKAMDYDWLCGISVTETGALSPADFVRKSTISDTIVIDVREKDELPKADFRCINIPLSELSIKMDAINEKNILLFCQSGKRSLKAVAILTEKFGTTKTIRHLKDGIMALQDKYNEQDN